MWRICKGPRTNISFTYFFLGLLGSSVFWVFKKKIQLDFQSLKIILEACPVMHCQVALMQFHYFLKGHILKTLLAVKLKKIK